MTRLDRSVTISASAVLWALAALVASYALTRLGALVAVRHGIAAWWAGVAVLSAIAGMGSAWFWLDDASHWAQGRIPWWRVLVSIGGWLVTVAYFASVVWYIATREGWA
jgi:hypothetical protein